MDNKKALAKIAREIEACTLCKKGKTGKAVPGEGNPDAEVVFIGEAPGKQEAETGRPFIGRSGQLLRSMIRGIGLNDEKDVYITSPVKYLPLGKDGTPGGTPTPHDIAHGRIHLMKQLTIIKPSLVVLLGRVAAEGVLQKKVAVVKERGQVIEEKDGPSRLGVEPRRRIKYFLTYHPAAVLRFPNKFKPGILADFQKVKGLIKKKV